MRIRLHFALLLLLPLGWAAAFGASATGPDSGRQLQLVIAKNDWGDASREDIQAVLKSAGGELWRHCPNTRLAPILVQHSDRDPITHFARDPQGRIVVGLTTRGRFWSQFAFQFSHEFGHILAVHPDDGRKRWKENHHANQWFEESLCETASLFALRQMARAWETHPPYPNWKSYAVHLRDYATQRMQDPKNQLPAGKNFIDWFREEAPSLRTNATQRAKNCVIAAQLLPRFEQTPARWEALTALNLDAREKNRSFARYLADWRDQCAPAHRDFVRQTARLFGVTLE